MFNQQNLLNITRSVKSHPRTITLTRSNREQELPFTVVGGTKAPTQGVFVATVDADSPADRSGMCVGDEVELIHMRFAHYPNLFERILRSDPRSEWTKSEEYEFGQSDW